jgi:hypothetical protein
MREAYARRQASRPYSVAFIQALVPVRPQDGAWGSLLQPERPGQGPGTASREAPQPRRPRTDVGQAGPAAAGPATRQRRRGLSPDQVDHAIHLYNLGWSLARVGNHLGVNHTTVLNKLRERGIHTRDTHGRPRVEAGGTR